MGNHSSEDGDSPISDAMRRAMNVDRKEAAQAQVDRLREKLNEPLLGATGRHTERKLTGSDEGEIQFAVGVKDGKVCLDFGTPCVWIGFSPAQALEIAELLIKHARAAARGTGSILTLNL